MYIEGRNPLIESLRAKHQFAKIYLEKGIKLDEKITEIVRRAKNKRIPVEYKSHKELDKMSKTFNHQGVIGVKRDEEQLSFPALLSNLSAKGKAPFIIYIREALYEFNIGAIVRTAECAGADAVLVPPKTTISPQLVRASMGATEHMPLIHESLFQAIKLAHDEGLRIVGIEVSGNQYYYEADLTGPLMLIIGGEDRSLSSEITEKCDSVVKIPLNGKVNSLNMSVAASIVIYDKIRQETVSSH